MTKIKLAANQRVSNKDKNKAKKIKKKRTSFSNNEEAILKVQYDHDRRVLFTQLQKSVFSPRQRDIASCRIKTFTI